jgi:glutathione S-transferase
MKVHGAKMGGNPIRVAIFLAEKGVDLPFVPVDLMKGAHREPAFLEMNPAAQVPVLELDDGTCISETIAICRYFERLHPEPPLFGVDALDEAIVEMWQRRIEFQLYLPAMHVLRHSIPAIAVLEPVQLEQWAELNRPRTIRGIEILDAQLASNEFVAGPRFTVADITAEFVVSGMLPMLGMEVPSGCRNVARWHEEVSARPSVASVRAS